MSDWLSFHQAGSLLRQCIWTVYAWGSLLSTSEWESFPPVHCLSPHKKKITVFWRAVNLQIELDDLLLIHRLFQIQMEVREGHRYVTVFWAFPPSPCFWCHCWNSPFPFPGNCVKELPSPRAKLALLASGSYLSRLGLCPTSMGSSLFMSLCYPNLLG